MEIRTMVFHIEGCSLLIAVENESKSISQSIWKRRKETVNALRFVIFDKSIHLKKNWTAISIGISESGAHWLTNRIFNNGLDDSMT